MIVVFGLQKYQGGLYIWHPLVKNVSRFQQAVSGFRSQVPGTGYQIPVTGYQVPVFPATGDWRPVTGNKKARYKNQASLL